MTDDTVTISAGARVVAALDKLEFLVNLMEKGGVEELVPHGKPVDRFFSLMGIKDEEIVLQCHRGSYSWEQVIEESRSLYHLRDPDGNVVASVIRHF